MSSETNRKPKKSRARAATIDALMNQGGFQSPFDTFAPAHPTETPPKATEPLLDEASLEQNIAPAESVIPAGLKSHKSPIIEAPLPSSKSNLTRNKEVLEVDPASIMPWQFADRPNEEILSIESLADDIRHNGQSSPVLLRKLSTSQGQLEYEYIYGCRRIEACRRLNISVKAICHDFISLPDTKAFALMFSENEQREGISSWARCKSFEKVLESGVFKSKRELSLAIGKHEDYLKDLTIYSRLPKELLESVGSFSKVSIGTAKLIFSLSKDKSNLPKLIELSEKIRSGTSPASIKARFRSGTSNKNTNRSYILNNGENLSVSKTAQGFSVKVGSQALSLIETDELVEIITKVLESKNKAT